MMPAYKSLSITLLSILPALGYMCSDVALAQTFVNVNASARSTGAVKTTSVSQFDAFRPKLATDKRRLDYQIWDDILRNIVVDFGISSRIRASRPANITGSRVATGHTSPYRLEGSRIAFGFLNDNYRDVLTQYRQDLIAIANQIDISRLSKDEQLAFWLNLHNVALIEKIALEYPEDVPSTMQIELDGAKVLLDDAKFIQIRGKILSLRDIRENVVFANWSNPIVMYGFFRGDIGGPRMPRTAFTANGLEYQLNGSANEFINSLRGFHEGRKARKVSALYKEAQPFYFPDWETDLAAHLKQFAEGEVLDELAADKPFEFDRYETMIADLSGGQRRASALAIEGAGNLPPETARLLAEVGEKQKILSRRGAFTGLNRGYVIIEDIDTNPDLPNQPTID